MRARLKARAFELKPEPTPSKLIFLQKSFLDFVGRMIDRCLKIFESQFSSREGNSSATFFLFLQHREKKICEKNVFLQIYSFKSVLTVLHQSRKKLQKNRFLVSFFGAKITLSAIDAIQQDWQKAFNLFIHSFLGGTLGGEIEVITFLVWRQKYARWGQYSTMVSIPTSRPNSPRFDSLHAQIFLRGKNYRSCCR